jgi:anti-sigma-K factor RskA
MSGAEREELDQLAGEYVLGTLAEPHRARFEQRLRGDPSLRHLVTDWQRRLGLLAERLPGVEPPPGVWAKVEAATAAPPPAVVTAAGRTTEFDSALRHVGLWWCIGLWRWLGIGGAAVATAFALYVAFVPHREPAAPAQFIAVLNDASANPAFVVTTNRDGARFVARPLFAPLDAAPDGVFELWVIAGGPPRSLGLLAPATQTARAIGPDLAHALTTRGAVLAVSREPTGGSPTGGPTGPILFQGKLVAAGG